MKNEHNFRNLYNEAFDKKMVFLEKLEKIQKDLLLFDVLATLQSFYGIDLNELKYHSDKTLNQLKKAIEKNTDKVEFEGKELHKSYIEAMIYFLDNKSVIDNFKKI